MTSKVNKFFILALSFSPLFFVALALSVMGVVPILFPKPDHRIQGINTSADPFGTPIRLEIPSIKVSASIESIGVTPNGEMGVPQNPLNVGWFQVGNLTSSTGNAVISGHLNQPNGDDGVFANLHRLKPGDDVFIDDNRGGLTIFVVREIRIYNSVYADEVFASNEGVHLNLVTCDGAWDKNKKSYSKRLVVFTDLK